MHILVDGSPELLERVSDVTGYLHFHDSDGYEDGVDPNDPQGPELLPDLDHPSTQGWVHKYLKDIATSVTYLHNGQVTVAWSIEGVPFCTFADAASALLFLWKLYPNAS